MRICQVQPGEGGIRVDLYSRLEVCFGRGRLVGQQNLSPFEVRVHIPGIELDGCVQIFADICSGVQCQVGQRPPQESRGEIGVLLDGFLVLVLGQQEIPLEAIDFADVIGDIREVNRLQGGSWLQVAAFGAGERVRAEPFEAVEFDTTDWFVSDEG